MKFGKLLRNYFTCDQDNEKFHQGQGEKSEAGSPSVIGGQLICQRVAGSCDG